MELANEKKEKKGKSPLWFLVPAKRSELRRKLEASNNLDWLLIFPYRYVRDFLLRVFPPPDSPEITAYLVRRIGEAIRGAILEKLKRDHPKDAHRLESVLVGTYPDRTGRILNQALCYLADCWIEDFIQHPRSNFASRCQRLLPSLDRLPNMRGKSALGTYHQLFFLMVYDIALEKLSPLGRIRRSPTDKDLQRRKKNFEEVFSELSQVNDPEQARGLFHPATGEIFFEVSEEDYEHWPTLPRNEIALEIAVKAIKTYHRTDPSGTHLRPTPEYLRRIRPKLRALASRLDTALKKV